MGRGGNFVWKLFEWLFFIHVALITILVIVLTVLGVLSDDHTHCYHAKLWYLLVFSSIACAGIVGFVWQLLTRCNPSRTFRATFWLSPLLTGAFGILLVGAETPASLAVSIVVIMCSFVQGLYACWVNKRFEHACKVLTTSTVYCPPKVKTTVFLSMIVGTLYSSCLMSGIGGATVFTVVRGLARGVSLISGDVDEFMFSCADCCSGVASRFVMYANRWGFVQVGAYNKGIVRASMATWQMFRIAGMERLIDSDLTSSFCFLSGLAAGSICGLVGGIPALFIYKNYATEVAMYTFLIGYFMNRVAMAWVQACVAAYYVAYAENTRGQQFDATIPNYIWDLQRSLA